MPKQNNIAPHDLRCLAERHEWEMRPTLVTDVGVFGHVGRNGLKITQQCDHCDSIRMRVVSRSTGELLYQGYEHSDHYRQALDEALTKNEARLRYYKAADAAMSSGGDRQRAHRAAQSA